MSIRDLFNSRDKKKRLSHIRNLVLLAQADGHTDAEEVDLILRIGGSAGLTQDELLRILKDPIKVPFYRPETFQERLEQLYDMVVVMLVDGEINTNEMEWCKIIAGSLGFKAAIIDVIVTAVLDAVVKGILFDAFLETLGSEYT